MWPVLREACDLVRIEATEMTNYLLGPFLAFLPKRWRESFPVGSSFPWRYSVILSGLLESALALLALVYWYSYSVTHWAQDAVYAAIQNGAEINPNAIGFAGLAIMFLHPLTWFICYCGVEGAVRLCAAFTDTVLGVFPLYLAEKVYFLFARGKDSGMHRSAPASQHYLASIVQAVLEKLFVARLPQVPDELFYTKDQANEILQIRSSRPKTDWNPPQVIVHEGRYFRLEACSRSRAPRPFVYTLRRLSAGVPGRSALKYSPEQPPVLVDH